MVRVFLHVFKIQLFFLDSYTLIKDVFEDFISVYVAYLYLKIFIKFAPKY